MKKLNPYSLAILVVGVVTFCSGFLIVDNHKEDVAKVLEVKNEKIESLEEKLDTKSEKVSTLVENKAQLEKQNADLKKEVEHWKDKSESPTVSPQPSRGETAKQAIVFEATAYTAFCDTGCTGKTATGYNVANTTKIDGMRVIATDPNVIPMYSIVEVQTKSDTFKAIALDTGGAIDGHRIDVLVGSKSVARQFGRQNVAITILREGKGT